MSRFLEHPSQARRVIGGLIVVGGVVLAVFTILERPLVGVGAYVIAVTGVVAIQHQTEEPVFDERDETISQKAAGRTLRLLGWGSAGVFPALTAAWGLGLFEWQPWSVAIALFVAAIYLTYGAFLIVLGRRR
jgi:Predicted membrane protein (DUF2178).